METISEAHLAPALEELLQAFPSKIRGFHSDHGAEFVNHTVRRLFEKLHVEFTRTRPRRSNDKAWAAYYACTVLSALRSAAPRIPIESSSILREIILTPIPCVGNSRLLAEPECAR